MRSAMTNRVRNSRRAVLLAVASAVIVGLAGTAAITIGGRWYVASRTPEWIQQLVESADAEKRRRSALLLNEFAPATDEVRNALIDALDDEYAGVRQQATYALARFGQEANQAVPALTDALSDSDVSVRANAAYALGEIAQPRQTVFDALADAKNDADPYVRRQARDAQLKIERR